MKRVATDSATRAGALQRAAEVGAAQAGRELGIPSATIRGWRARSQEPAPRSAEESRVQGDRQQKGADRTWKVAEAALRKALEAIEKGDTLAAQRLMVSAGIAADKTGQLEEAAARAVERHVRLGESQGQVIVEVIRAFAEALGVPLGVPARKVLGDLLRQAGGGGVLVASPADAEAARAELREHIARELADVSGAVALLPAAAESDVDVVGGQLDIVSALEGSSEEVVPDAEVVDDLPDGWLSLHHNDPVAARKAYERFQAEKREREERKRESPDAWRVGRGDGIGGPLTEVFRAPSGGM